MAPSNMHSGENTFHYLLLELKFMVFDLLLVKDGQDFALRAEESEGNLQMLEKFQAWDETVLRDAMSWASARTCRFVLCGEYAPRRAVCRALRRLPEFFRHEITRVCLPNFRLPNKNNAVFKVCTDVRAGMLLLQTFLSIRQIDIELDLAEFLYRSGPTNNRALSCALVLTFRLLEDLRNFKHIGDIQIRVRWIRTVCQRPVIGDDRLLALLKNKPEERRKYEKKVLEALKARIPAKSIEDTHAWE